jgi:hypothetical protein
MKHMLIEHIDVNSLRGTCALHECMDRRSNVFRREEQQSEGITSGLPEGALVAQYVHVEPLQGRCGGLVA